MVPGGTLEPPLGQARLVRLARRAQQLGVLLLRVGLGAGRGDGSVLPAPVQPQAAGPQLGEPAGPRGGLRDDAVVARPGRRRLPDGRHQPDLQGARPAGRRAGTGRALRQRLPARRVRPPPGGVPAGDEPGGLRMPPGRLPDGGGDAGGDRRAGPVLHRSRQRRGRHGLPVRARRPRRWTGRQVRRAAARHGAAARVPHALAGGPRRDRLELALLGQPRPAPRRLPVRGRRSRMAGAVRQDAGHRPAPAPGHAVHLPGRGAGHDQQPLRDHRRLPRHRVAQLLRGDPARARRPRGAPRGAALQGPRQRPHPDAVGRLAARRLHDRHAVDRGQPRLHRDQRGGAGRRPHLGLRALPAPDRPAPRRPPGRARVDRAAGHGSP